jgi:hypothetical protein
MDEQRRHPWLRRLVDLAGWLTSMFEEPRGRRRLSMTRCAVAAFTVAYVVRLWFLDSLGWPDAWLAFCVLMALPIAKALDRAPASEVVGAVTGMFGKGMERVGGWMSERTAAWGSAVDDPTVPMGRAEVE